MKKLQHEHLSHSQRHFRVTTEGTCCEMGVRVHCICRVSVRCPVHGSICVGTHD